MECGVRNICVKHCLFHRFNRFFLDVNLKYKECEDRKYVCSILKNLGRFYRKPCRIRRFKLACLASIGSNFN